jgi:putative transposase
MLDDRLFSLNLEGWEASIAVQGGRAKLKLLHGTYHDKFKEMKFGQAWLVKMPFIRRLYSPRPLSFRIRWEGCGCKREQRRLRLYGARGERGDQGRIIRTAYFFKRRRLQSKPRLDGKPLMAKYKGRERRMVEEVYHKLANQIVDEAKELKASTIVLEELANIRKRVRRSKAVNGRLNRWSFRKLQEYEVKLAGLNVTYAEGASSLCPTCGGRLSPNGYRQMECRKCGLKQNRDIIAVRNLLHRYQMGVGFSSVHPESLL